MNRWAAWTSLGIVLASWAVSAAIFPMLPERIPSHWDIQGKVDGHSSRMQAALILPIMLVVMAGVFAALPWMSPKGFSLDQFKGVYSQIVVTALALFLYMHVVSYAASLTGWDVGRAIVIGAMVAIGFMGNQLGKVRPNFFVGVRTPWTIASERVWTDTHRLAAWVFVGAGIVGSLATMLGANLLVAFGILMAATLMPVVYSFVHYKRLERRGEIENPKSGDEGKGGLPVNANAS